MCTARRSSAEWTFLAVAVLGGLITLLQMWLVPKMKEFSSTNDDAAQVGAPMILWWTSSFGEGEGYRYCGEDRCYFTRERSNWMNPHLKAVLFYGSNVEVGDLPIPRGENVRWALLHEESPRNNPMFVHRAAQELFNYSATFSRYSDLPLTLLSLSGVEDLLGTRFYLPVDEKNELAKTKKLSPVLYIQSDCDTASDRDSYVEELMKHIEVDSYGGCLNNRQLPRSLRGDYLERLDSEEFLTFVAQYKFTLAFENAVCDDYITEKLWRPLIVGSLPVYYGSPTFEDWLPNNKSAIAVRDFVRPKDLADFLLMLNENDELYEGYMIHKLSDPLTAISNKDLLRDLGSRPKNLYSVFAYYVRAFECLVCNKLHDTKSSSKMSPEQYNCPLPKRILSSETNQRNPWSQQWMLDKCAAKLLSQHVSNGTEVNIDHFTEQMFSMYKENNC